MTCEDRLFLLDVIALLVAALATYPLERLARRWEGS